MQSLNYYLKQKFPSGDYLGIGNDIINGFTTGEDEIFINILDYNFYQQPHLHVEETRSSTVFTLYSGISGDAIGSVTVDAVGLQPWVDYYTNLAIV